MNIRKLPSGNYQIRLTENGKNYSLTVDHKPTKLEALRLLSNVKPKKGKSLTLLEACRAYIESKNNILSVSTIRGYEGLIRAIKPDLGDMCVSDIDKATLQNNINEYSKDHSPKTVKNYGHFILSVLSMYENEIRGITFPRKESKQPYIPTEEEVQAIFKAVKGTKYEAPILLSGLGLRRSEIVALTLSDLSEDNVLTINKAKVQDKDYNWKIKETKITESTRSIVLPDYLADLIRKQGYIYNGHPELIYRTLVNVEKALGIPHFPLHKMRHFCMSYLHNLGYTDKQLQEIGGYKTNYILDNVYKHAMDMEQAKKDIAKTFNGLM